MPQTTVSTPIGDITVDHPEGASDRQILSFAKQEADRRAARRAEIEASYERETGLSDNPFVNFAAGAGKAFVDLGRGAKQLAVEGANLVPGVDLDDYAGELRQRSTDVRERDADLMGSGAGLAGNIGANVALALAPGGLARGGSGALATGARAFSNPNTYRAAAASGGLQGALQPVGEDESRAFNTALGGSFGVAGRAITQPFATNASRGAREAIDRLESSGIPLDVAERTQSGAAARLGALLDDSFITGGSRQNFKDTQLRAFTRAALETMGENADEATESVMRNARTRIGGVFEEFGNTKPTQVGSRFFDDMRTIYADAQKSMTRNEFGLFERNWRDIMQSIDSNQINGSRFSAHLRHLGKLSRRADVGEHARSMEHALLDALEATHPGERGVIRLAREQWRNMRTIQNAINKGEDRFISPLRLSNALTTKQNQNLSVFGLGGTTTQQLSALARAGRQVLGDFANSGTALRQQGVTAGIGSALALVGGLPAVLAGAAGARGLNSAFQNQGILGNLLAGQMSPLAAAPIKQGLISTGTYQQERLLNK